MSNVGDPVFFNESNNELAPSWCPAQILRTDTQPADTSVAAIVADPDFGGAYPPKPAAGQVILAYWQMAGMAFPSSVNTTYATEGTGPQQYSTSIPAGW